MFRPWFILALKRCPAQYWKKNIHLGGGGKQSFARMDSVGGGGGSSGHFPGSSFCGGVVAESHTMHCRLCWTVGYSMVVLD